MTDRWEAQYQFWSSFGVPAYEENSVPTGDLRPAYPYITYQAAAGGFNSNIFVNASIWTRSGSWLTADTLADAIEQRLGGRSGGGYVQRYDGGGIWITAEDNFAQNMGDTEDNIIKRKLLSVVLRYV